MRENRSSGYLTRSNTNNHRMLKARSLEFLNKKKRDCTTDSENNQRTNGPENAHLKPDPGVLSHHEMTLTLNTHTPLLNS